jgi:lysozyme family protein
MQSNFDACTTLVLRTEGGYVDNPRDPGGPTNKGVTLATARALIAPTFTRAALQALSVAQAETVYRASYWNKIDGDRLPSGVDYALYDYAVNSGTGRANRVIRQLVGAAPGTTMDAAVLAAIGARRPADLVRAICAERLAFMRSLKTWGTFGKGWAARVAAVEAHAVALAVDPTAGVTLAVGRGLDAAVAVPKATVKRLPRHVVADGAAGRSTIAAGAAVAGAAGATASGFHLGGLATTAIAVAAFCAVGAIVFLVDRAKAAAAVKPAAGTAVVPTIPSPTPVAAGLKA